MTAMILREFDVPGAPAQAARPGEVRQTEPRCSGLQDLTDHDRAVVAALTATVDFLVGEVDVARSEFGLEVVLSGQGRTVMQVV